MSHVTYEYICIFIYLYKFICIYICIHIHGWSGEGLKLEVETLYTERLFSVYADVSRFEWESLAIV